MNKFAIILFAVCLAFAGGTPFTYIRVASSDVNGDPEEEIIDLSICLERTPTAAQQALYEDVIGYFADGLYELSNGGNYLGAVRIYTGERFCTSTTIQWYIDAPWPGSGGSFFWVMGVLGCRTNGMKG